MHFAPQNDVGGVIRIYSEWQVLENWLQSVTHCREAPSQSSPSLGAHLAHCSHHFAKQTSFLSLQSVTERQYRLLPCATRRKGRLMETCWCPHLLCPPDMAPSNFWFLFKVKMTMEGKGFQLIQGTKAASAAQLKTFSKKIPKIASEMARMMTWVCWGPSRSKGHRWPSVFSSTVINL